MTINVPTLVEIAGLGGLLWMLARKGFQFLEILIKAILLVYRQNGEEVPTWFANQYKKVNGNAHASTQEKHDLLGAKHDSGEHDIRANAKSAGDY